MKKIIIIFSISIFLIALIILFNIPKTIIISEKFVLINEYYEESENNLFKFPNELYVNIKIIKKNALLSPDTFGIQYFNMDYNDIKIDGKYFIPSRPRIINDKLIKIKMNEIKGIYVGEMFSYAPFFAPLYNYDYPYKNYYIIFEYLDIDIKNNSDIHIRIFKFDDDNKYLSSANYSRK